MKLIPFNLFNGYHYSYQELSFGAVLIMLSVIAFLLLLSKTLRNEPIKIPEKEFNDFSYDMLQPQAIHVNVRKVNVSTKIVLYMLSGILIYTPFDELLNVSHYFYYSSWEWIF